MADDGATVSRDAFQRMRRAVNRSESEPVGPDLDRVLARHRQANRQLVYPTSSSITDGGVVYWPGKVVVRREDPQGWVDLGNVWISDVNGETLTVGKRYKATHVGKRTMNGEATPRSCFATNVICCGSSPPPSNLPRRLQIVVLGPSINYIAPIWPFRIEGAQFDRVPGTRLYNWVPGTGEYERQGFPTQQWTANEAFRSYLEFMTVPPNLPPLTLGLRIRLPFFTFSPIGSEFGYDGIAYIREEILQSGNLAGFRFVSRRNSIGQTVTFPPSPTGPFPNFSWTTLENVFPPIGGGPNIGCWAYVIE